MWDFVIHDIIQTYSYTSLYPVPLLYLYCIAYIQQISILT